MGKLCVTCGYAVSHALPEAVRETPYRCDHGASVGLGTGHSVRVQVQKVVRGKGDTERCNDSRSPVIAKKAFVAPRTRSTLAASQLLPVFRGKARNTRQDVDDELHEQLRRLDLHTG